MNTTTPAVLAVEMRQDAAAAAGRKAIPFDYTTRFGPRLEKDVKRTALLQVSVEAPFVATGLGYGFVLPAAGLTFGAPPSPPPAPALAFGAAAPVAPPPDVFEAAFAVLQKKLAAAPLGGLTLDTALASGIRLNPKYAAQLLPRGGRRAFSWKALPTLPDDLFIVHSDAPGELQFLYAIHDQGTGRAFQNDMVLSTAGLGAPDGQRPFRQFATPVQFASLTTIRIEVVPLQTLVGELHFSLHGYKVLGSPGSPTDISRVARRLRRRARR